MASSSPAEVVAEPEVDAAAALPGKNASFRSGSTVLRTGILRVVHPHVAELLRSQRRHARPAAKPAALQHSLGRERARYACAFEDDVSGVAGLAAPGRLVWGKVRDYPWWPGQVVDAADASTAARVLRRPRGAVLVAYFWDKTFSWNDPTAATLRPFRTGFPRVAAMAPVADAVDAALAEVARRVAAGLSCSCGGGGGANSRQVMDNAGVRDGASGAPVDAAFARGAFQGEALVGYVSALATNPSAGADWVDLTIAAAQLEAFGRRRRSAGVISATAKRRRSSTAFARGALRGEALVGYVSALATNPCAGADSVDLTVAAAQLEAFGRCRLGDRQAEEVVDRSRWR